jgi:hypothetical protein
MVCRGWDVMWCIRLGKQLYIKKIFILHRFLYTYAWTYLMSGIVEIRCICICIPHMENGPFCLYCVKGATFFTLVLGWLVWEAHVRYDYTVQYRFCPMRKKVCLWCIIRRWIQERFQNFCITHTFGIASDYVKAQVYICRSLGACMK